VDSGLAAYGMRDEKPDVQRMAGAGRFQPGGFWFPSPRKLLSPKFLASGAGQPAHILMDGSTSRPVWNFGGKKTLVKSIPPSWRNLMQLRRAVRKRMRKDRFFETVLAGCFRVGQDKGNPLRGNFLASGLREAIGHVLHSLAPDEEVRACIWFVQAKDTPTVTRQQRASYIVRAGLPDQFVSDTLKIDVRKYTKPLIEMMDGLSKATHVRSDTILSKGTKIRQMVQDVLLGIDQLLQAAADSREAITGAVANVMDAAVFKKFIFETIQELDELSTHTTVDDHQIDEVSVTKLDSVEIRYRVTGEVMVQLQYGSDSDVDNDMGVRLDDSYPYVATITCAVAQPMDVRADNLDVMVDNQSFFE
jgi:hypothetical protein